jgi:hypothetical protein
VQGGSLFDQRNPVGIESVENQAKPCAHRNNDDKLN